MCWIFTRSSLHSLHLKLPRCCCESSSGPHFSSLLTRVVSASADCPAASNNERLDVLQENEKLYLQLKAEKSRSKASKDAMFQENQSLLSQLAFLRLS